MKAHPHVFVDGLPISCFMIKSEHKIMRRGVAVLVMSLFALLPALSQTISSIERSGNWYYIYDDSGKRTHTLSVSSIGTVVGWGNGFFVSKSGNWIYLFDSNGKRYKTLSVSSVGEVISVSGDTFTSRNGNWIYLYDKMGKKISTRAASR